MATKGDNPPPKKKLKVSPLADLLTVDDDDPASSFDSIMDVLLNRCVLLLNNGTVRYRLIELEIYCLDAAIHNDTFTHGDSMQERFLAWYFHKSGSGYKGGTYKGLDLALGKPGRPIGVLIRSVAPMDDVDNLVSGSCLCVDRLLEVTSQPDIPSFVRKFGIEADTNDGMCLEIDDTIDSLPIVQTARVGLSLKTKTSESDLRWWGKKYRYTTSIKLRKGKNLMVCAMLESGKSAVGITTANAIEKYKRAHEKGKKMDDPTSFLGKSLSVMDECELLGALSR